MVNLHCNYYIVINNEKREEQSIIVDTF